MNGIDTAIASLLASRVDSLLNIAPGSATTAQTGAAGLDSAPATGTPNVAPVPPPASAQTALSAVALTLDAIVRSGGEATPAIVGQLPIWPAAPALDIEIGALPLFDEAAAGASGSSNASSSTTSTPFGANAAAGASGASVVAAQVPVSALAAALQQTVGDSGLFYESHLAQWLAGQRSPADLAGEAQNKLVASSTQLPLDWANDAEGGGAASSAASTAQRQGAASNGSADASGAARGQPPIQTVQAARFAAGEVLANSLSDLNGQAAHSALHSATAQTADSSATPNSQSMAAAIHPATIPLVRQQLDMLATGQFRWTGEAWPGARLDWTVEQEGDEWDRSGGGAESEDDHPWHTRLTLSLPSLGTVDAELTLTGTRLVARVQASPGGAARLSAQGEDFRRRLAAAGIELNGLTVREIGGGVPGSAPAGAAAAQAAQAAASAYARSASNAANAARAAGPAQARGGKGRAAPPLEDFDWDM